MATHFWLFPWLALAAGLAAVLIAWRDVAPMAASALSFPPRSVWVLWACVVAGALAAGLTLGAAGGFDFLAARGLLLGALGGLPLVVMGRRAPPASRPALMLGLGTAMVAAGRLWLTHAEITGLAALALGAALTALCLGGAPALGAGEAETDTAASDSVLGLLYLVSLTATVALGFLRAHTLSDMVWADIPLLLTGGLSVGSALGAGWVRRSPSVFARLLPPVAGAILVLLLLASVTAIGRLAGLLAVGAVLFVVLSRLSARSSSEDGAVGGLVGLVMIVAGATLAFALGSGYGLGLFVLGGWLVSGLFLADAEGVGAPLPRREAAGALGFAALLLVYRLGVLQGSAAARAGGPGDTWDLFAVCLGALLPLLAAEWAWGDARTARRPVWAAALLWILSLVFPAVILDYIWQPRSVAGLLLGAALGQLLAGVGGDARRRLASTALSGVVFSLVLFLFLPILGHGDAPTRTVRLVLILAGAALVLGRVFLPGRRQASDAGGPT